MPQRGRKKQRRNRRKVLRILKTIVLQNPALYRYQKPKGMPLKDWNLSWEANNNELKELVPLEANLPTRLGRRERELFAAPVMSREEIMTRFLNEELSKIQPLKIDITG